MAMNHRQPTTIARPARAPFAPPRAPATDAGGNHPRSAARRPHARAAFTFVEVICILLVVIMGVLGAVGLATYGMKISHRAQGQSTGLATAISVATDPQPLLDPVVAPNWTYTPYNLDSAVAVTSTASGFINGYYVERTETSTPADIIAVEGATVHARSAQVSVDVWDTFKGALVASYNTRIIRQRTGP
jgi:Tfp pilus assembly protein PilV